MSSDTSLPIQTNTPSSSSTSFLAPSDTPTPTGQPATPAPSRNPSMFPGSDAQRDNFANADYLNALAAAAQASLQSAPSSPGGDLPIARSGNRNSVYGLPGGEGSRASSASRGGRRHDEDAEGDVMEDVMEEEEGEGEGAQRRGGAAEMFNTTSFLDIDSSTPVTTPGSTVDDFDEDVESVEALPPESVAGGPVHGGDAMDEDAEEEREGRRVNGREYGGFTDPLARARAGVSVAKGEGFVERASVMLDREVVASGQGTQVGLGEQAMRREMGERVWKGGPVQGVESAGDGKGLS